MADLIDRWSADSMELVQAAVSYAKAGTYDASADANIRTVRVMCQVLLSAAAQAAIPPPPPNQFTVPADAPAPKAKK
jgi:hypothetical protein